MNRRGPGGYCGRVHGVRANDQGVGSQRRQRLGQRGRGGCEVRSQVHRRKRGQGQPGGFAHPGRDEDPAGVMQLVRVDAYAGLGGCRHSCFLRLTISSETRLPEGMFMVSCVMKGPCSGVRRGPARGEDLRSA